MWTPVESTTIRVYKIIMILLLKKVSGEECDDTLFSINNFFKNKTNLVFWLNLYRSLRQQPLRRHQFLLQRLLSQWLILVKPTFLNIMELWSSENKGDIIFKNIQYILWYCKLYQLIFFHVTYRFPSILIRNSIPMFKNNSMVCITRLYIICILFYKKRLKNTKMLKSHVCRHRVF